VNIYLVFGKRGFAVERASTILDTAEKAHLLCGTIPGTVYLALVAIQIAFVLKAATTVHVLTCVSSNIISRRILVITVVWFVVWIC